MGEQRYRVPDQPDGIDDDSRDVPDPIRAARRIRAYVTGAGDGLYDVVNPGDGPRPLYGRDLEAVCRALVARTRERDAAIARAEDHRRAAHQAAGQLDALRRQRDQLDAALAELLDEVHIEIGTPEYRDRVLAVHARSRAVLHAVRGGAPGPVNEVVDGLPYPCQPIGCDAGRHLAGCVYASADCGDAWHSAPGETAPPDSCPTCGGGHG